VTMEAVGIDSWRSWPLLYRSRSLPFSTEPVWTEAIQPFTVAHNPLGGARL
jgi:hypothetical protein